MAYIGWTGSTVTTGTVEQEERRIGRPPSGLPPKPNVNVILHDRLWAALGRYGDGSAVRGLERAVTEARAEAKGRRLGSAAQAELVRDVAAIAPAAELVRVVLPPPPAVPTVRRAKGAGRPARKNATCWRRHNLTLDHDVRAQLVLFGGGSFRSGVERVALLVGVGARRA